MSFEAAVHAKAIRLNTLSLQMTADAGSGHPTTCMSLGHITTVLMYHAMRWVPEDPGLNTADRLVLSEGHAVPIVYAAFIDLGAMVGKPGEMRPATLEDVDGFRATDSPLDGHPNPREGFEFFDAATGSLGQGLSVAVGLGLAAKGDEIDQRIFCVIGDGESREGQIWEAVDSLVELNVCNVLPIFNCNGLGQAAAVSDQQSPERIAAKLEAYGVRPVVIDGHDPAAIAEAISQFTDGCDTPMAIVARTVKGWGVKSMQGAGWHGKPATGDKLEAALQELAATGAGLTSSLAGSELAIYPPTTTQRPEPAVSDVPTFREAMAAIDQATVLQVGRLATRKAFGVALRTLGRHDGRVWTVDADVQNSTFTDAFATSSDTADRFVECKIAEQNMFSLGAGISAAGKNVFAASFGKFITRGYDQIEMAMNSGANLKIVGSHCGISLAADGPSQMALPDVAWFRSLGSTRDHNGNPGCWVLQPADAWAAYGLTMEMGDYEGMCYMRVFRPEVEFLYDENTTFEFGGMEMLTEGRDLLIVSAGYMLHECNKALDSLDRMGIDASLLDLYSLPFDEDRLLDYANDNGGNVLVVEDNYGGGLFSAVSEACVKAGDAFTIEPMHVTRIPKSSRNADSVLEQCGMDHASISARAASMLGIAAHAH
ncbi:MAG: transketolase [Phycisphaerales bacterium]|nr:transketolase [Phycisphaerales bacterium]